MYYAVHNRSLSHKRYNPVSKGPQTLASEAGVCRGSDAQLFMWGILICIYPPRKT